MKRTRASVRVVDRLERKYSALKQRHNQSPTFFRTHASCASVVDAERRGIRRSAAAATLPLAKRQSPRRSRCAQSRDRSCRSDTTETRDKTRTYRRIRW
ncbi:hypothetical protein BE221DRAFT_78603 [Ostreococcus tauri]|uniref:Uncharacterized protein n=1 Tax=Ostreococcus tauri TaxID=70448 RepID=A0A1Y5I6H7_OSTTA|nr:hypothetical protein BE221DRAFT_78603 [Ostreococcus tauri]